MLDDHDCSFVQLFASGEKWTVRVIDKGDVAEQYYETHEFAKSFAAGQAIRLGVSVTLPCGE